MNTHALGGEGWDDLRLHIRPNLFGETGCKVVSGTILGCGNWRGELINY